MKKITLSMSFMLLCLLGISTLSNAQGVRRSSFRVDAPASIQGYKIIDEIDSTSTTSPWGTSIDSTWEGMDVKYDPNNLDGCAAFAPGFFTGKFAMIYRGGCEFGSKAKKAQDAGAKGVIIVNNLLGVVGMGAGADGALVEIPVVMVTTVDGNAIKAQIDAGNPVSVSLAAWRFDPVLNPIDVGFMNDGPVLPLGRTVPAHQVSTAHGNTDENFRLFSGARFYNFSVNTWDTLFQFGRFSYKSTFTGGTYSPQDSNSINWFFTNQVHDTDSINFVMIDSLSGAIAGFDMNDAAKGVYKVDNQINTIPFTETGLAPLNNTWSHTCAVTDSIYSKCEYDFVNNRPIANSYVNVSSVAEWGPVLYIRNGGYSAKKVQVVVMRDVIDDSVFNGQDVFVTLSKWSDNDGNGAIDPNTELDEIATGIYSLTASDIVPINGLAVTINLDNSITPGQLIKLEDGAKYWLHISLPGSTNGFGMGTDYYSDYSANLNLGVSEGNPLLFNGTMFGGGFANAGSPSIALLMNTNKAESVNDFASINGQVSVYPNPTKSDINVALDLEKSSTTVVYEIMDITGKTIATQTKSNVTSDVFTYNTSKLSAGTYFVNITTDNGKSQSKFVVTK